MTKYIVKEFKRGDCVRRAIITIPKGQHPKKVPSDSPIYSWPSGTRLFYESNGQEVGFLWKDKTGDMRITWHRL